MNASPAIGSRFGLLTVTGEAEPSFDPSGKKRRRIAVRCDCGTTLSVQRSHLISGSSGSCGCITLEKSKVNRKTHGESSSYKRTPEYQCWLAMRVRCSNPKAINYADYGGRGVKVCEKWKDDFAAFLADMGRKPSPQHSIDRYPDTNGNYEPGNCRWATPQEQSMNRRPRRKGYTRRVPQHH